MVTVEEIRRAQRAEGPATVLAIGTATPSNCVDQSTYPDYYFRITNSEHMTDLKEKFKRMCMISYFLLSFHFVGIEIQRSGHIARGVSNHYHRNHFLSSWNSDSTSFATHLVNKSGPLNFYSLDRISSKFPLSNYFFEFWIHFYSHNNF